MAHFVVAGGAGFVGSHMVDHLLAVHKDATVSCFDKLSYASDSSLRNLQGALFHERFTFHKVDLAQDNLDDLFAREFAPGKKVTLFNFAAESCVDRSFTDPLLFTQNNILATQRLLETCLKHGGKNFHFIHISTDEVYGQQLTGAASESAPLLPSNPYAASKAACDLLLHSYRTAYNVPISILRPNNIYGPRQHPEKLVPRVLQTIGEMEAGGVVSHIPVHGSGLNTRRYLHVHDFVRAANLVYEAGSAGGGIYNVGTMDEVGNLDLVAKMMSLYMQDTPNMQDTRYLQYVEFVQDRPFNDQRYAVEYDKIADLGWKQQIPFHHGLQQLIENGVSHIGAPSPSS